MTQSGDTGRFRARVAALAVLRVEDADPAHGGVADRKRGGRNAEHVAAVAAWDRCVGSLIMRDALFRHERLIRAATGKQFGGILSTKWRPPHAS